jgi:hypothetical protein
VIDVASVALKIAASTIQRLSPDRVKMAMSQEQANHAPLRESMDNSGARLSTQNLTLIDEP